MLKAKPDVPKVARGNTKPAALRQNHQESIRLGRAIMKFPIAIEVGSETRAWGVVVPDLPGCFSAGDTADEAYANAKIAIEAWINTALDNGDIIPKARPMEALMQDSEYKGWAWGVVDVDLADFEDTIERVNITLPRRVLTQIDRYTERRHENRSSFLLRAALESMAEHS
jgi:predicted RNase H-like HicB family nuclease